MNEENSQMLRCSLGFSNLWNFFFLERNRIRFYASMWWEIDDGELDAHPSGRMAQGLHKVPEKKYDERKSTG